MEFFEIPCQTGTDCKTPVTLQGSLVPVGLRPIMPCMGHADTLGIAVISNKMEVMDKMIYEECCFSWNPTTGGDLWYLKNKIIITFQNTQRNPCGNWW